MVNKLFIVQKYIFLFILSGFIVIPGTAHNSFNVTHYSTADGLKSNRTVRVIQDKRGFYWFGTIKGIQRFDGYEFKEFKVSDQNHEMNQNFEVHKLFLTVDSTLLIGTSLGLLEFNEGKNEFQWIPFPAENNEYRVTDICAINDSTYFLNSHTPKGVFIYRKGQKMVEHATSRQQSLMKNPKVRLVLKGPEDTFFFHISYDLYQYDSRKDTFFICSKGELPEKEYFHYGMTDAEGTFWLISEKGLYYMNANREMIRVKDIDRFCSLSQQVGSSVIAASDTSIYVAFDWWGVVEISTQTKKVISVLRKTATTLTELNSNQNYSLYRSDDDILWWCSDGAYMITKDHSDKKFIHSGASAETQNFSVLEIMEDSKGTVWVGTDGGGLHTYSIVDNKNTPVTSDFNRNLPDSKVIVSLFEDRIDHELWVGTYEDGMFRYRHESNELTHFQYHPGNSDGIQNNRIWDINRDNYGNMLVSSYCSSVDIYNKEDNTWKHLSVENGQLRGNCVTRIEKDAQGVCWFGYTDEGFDVYDDKKQRMTNRVSPTKDRVMTMLLEKDTLWLGCMKGLKIYSQTTKQYYSHPISKTFKDTRIYDLFKDSENRIWVVAENGLYYFLKNDTVPHLSVLNAHFENNIAKCITESHHGYLLIGGINGLLSIPTPVARNVKYDHFNIHITDFRLFGKSYNVTNSSGKPLVTDDLQHITLPYDKNYLGISFSTMDLPNINKVGYSVRVGNYYPQWVEVEAGSNKLDLPNLNPGNYKVEIKAWVKDNPGLFKTRTFTIEITPPFWQTWWFRIGVVVLLIAVVLWRLSQIKNQNKLLSRLVKQRTSELVIVNAKLEKLYEKEKERKIVIEIKNAELTKTLETKDKLLVVIGHDFKDPVGALTANSHLLSKNIDTYSSEEIQKLANRIHSISNSLSHQLITLLDWARGEMNMVDYKPIDINLESIVVDAVQLLKHVAQEKSIIITLESDYEFNAYVDAHMVSTVVRNLLSNAIKFTSKGGNIFIELKEKNNELVVSFTDSGRGMEPEKAKRLFGEFNPELISFGTANERGSGLGLQICKSFVKINGGKIEVSSELEKGSVFTVFLPKAESVARKHEYEEITDGGSLQLAEDSANFTVLIIEDNPDILHFLEESLKNNYQIITATNGVAGFQLVQEVLPDIVISDIQLPQMNGLELCEKIRYEKLTKHIPVILITAQQSEDLEKKGYELGAIDFLFKPFDVTLLQQKVATILQTRNNFRKKIEKELAEGNYNLPTSFDDEEMNKILSVVKENFTDPDFDIHYLAEQVSLSRTQLWRKLKSVLNKTPSELIRDMRLNKAVEMLKSGKYRISEITYHVGFSDQRYFSRVFQKEFGITPSEFIKREQV